MTITRDIEANTKTMRETMSKLEVSLAELSGVRICASPGCTIILKEGQGKRTLIGAALILTCFQHRCIDWAEREQRTS